MSVSSETGVGTPDHKYDHYVTKQWRAAALMTRDIPDPWIGLGFDEIEEEWVTRHMYNPLKKCWKEDAIVVKVQSRSFAHGAMRECFRMKKLSKFSQNPNWKNASNYVAKRYMKEVERETYFDDVKLQMDSKLWGEEYSKHNVPKKVDFCQTYIIEFKGREGSPLYGVEHYIDGGYIKYNSNTGFVSNINRLTPQAFSHFTFEKSNHQLIVVDIQGVGDLYTDPQMHTVDMKDYGEANLGTRGMALFFSSHICSSLCESLGLTQFDLSEEEVEGVHSKRSNFSSPRTKISVSDDDPLLGDLASTFSTDSADLGLAVARKYNQAYGNSEGARPMPLRLSDSASDDVVRGVSSFNPESPLPLDSPGIEILVSSHGLAAGIHSPEHAIEVGEKVGHLEGGRDAVDFEMQPGVSASVSRVKTELRDKLDNVSCGRENGSLQILGLIHLDLANYHEMGRFSKSHLPNLNSVMYHLTKSAHCGNVEALYTLAHVYLQQSHDKFKDLAVETTSGHECEGMEYLVQAAERGLKDAMLEVARALDMGSGLRKAPDNDPNPNFHASQRYQNWPDAVKWYSRVLSASRHDSTDSNTLAVAEPDYSILARMADMHLSGGHGLDREPQRAGELYMEAAEAAMNAMKGKLATKYYMLAEEVWGEV